ncbi:suppressor protein SRP40-like [Juglans microcarpa x Juglans regia]|uniref:suppressor protein SRP40-like n=1 Tax=Juglans microcarpa x Juglans regia TaxID=2249226 RepID=UPI001B7E7E38|nr:suppressor protein SRP40-like [Juglans microcarpa x Juglans regia]
MATTKGKVSSSTLGKEKRTAVPSNSRTASAAAAATTTKSRANTATTTSSTHHKASSSSTTDKKHGPSYLKPTISSRTESFKYVIKKSGPEDTQQKATPTYIRRRSFDKPQSDSRLRSALVSPGPRVRTLTVRSTSFSPRSTATSLEPSGERTPKKTLIKAGRPQASHAKTMKKSTNPVAKKEISAASVSTEAPKINVDTTDSLSHQSVEDGGDFLVCEVEEVAKVEGEGAGEVLKYENDQQTDVADSEVNNGEDDEKHESCNIPEVSEEMSTNLDAQIEEDGDKIPEEEAENPPEGEVDNGSKDERNESHQEESTVASEARVEVKEDIKGEDQDAEDRDSGDENKNIEDNSVDEKEGMDGESEGLNSKEGEDVLEGGAEETKPVVAASTASSNRQVGRGKKESQAYNDVIEETASKLLEERKNKVRALVGAFETVIDKEASSK